MVERDRLHDVADEQCPRTDEPPVASRELCERAQVVRGDAELERALLLQRGRDSEEERRDKCQDLSQNAETLRNEARQRERVAGGLGFRRPDDDEPRARDRKGGDCPAGRRPLHRRRASCPRKGGPSRGSTVEPRRVGAVTAPPDPVALLEEQAETRVPELVPIRYGRMLVSPFTFYRGGRVPHGRRSLRTARAPACTRSSAATRTCRTSARSWRPTGGSSSASTTSTRRCQARSSGT